MTAKIGHETEGLADNYTSKAIGVACALLVVALFCGFTLISRMGRSSDLSLLDLAALRFGIGGLLLLPVVLRYGLSGVSWRNAVTMAFLGGFGFALLAYTGFYLAPAAHGAVLLHGTLPLTTFLILAVIGARQDQHRAVMGTALIALGITIMAWDSLQGASLLQLVGDGSLLLASLCWSAYGIMFRRLGLAPIRSAAIVAVLSMLCFLPFYFATQGGALFDHPWQDLLGQAVFQGVLIGVVSIFVYSKAVAILGTTETAFFTAAVPGVTALAAIPLLSEWPSFVAWTGVAIVTSGMFVAIARASSKQKS